MNMNLVKDFLRGRFDPPQVKQEYEAKLEQAKIKKPKTIRVLANPEFKFRGAWELVARAPKERKTKHDPDGLTKNHPFGMKCIAQSSKSGRWYVNIKMNARSVHVGTFDTLAQAIVARDEALTAYRAGRYEHTDKHYRRKNDE